MSKQSTYRRNLAVILCAQPILWMSGPAYAQAVQGLGGSSERQIAPVTNGPSAPGDPEVLRPGVSGMAPAALPAAVLDEAVDANTYICGPGDVFDLNFWGAQNFKIRLTVDVEGRGFVPKVGYFVIRGKTLSEARLMLRESVARFYPGLRFDITLTEPRSFLVQVVDAVARPGSVEARATDRVANVLAKAGLAASASQRRIEVRRRNGQALRVDLLLYGLTGDVKYNPYLLDGDVVRVPFEDLGVTIAGAVNRPGRYELVGTRDLSELLDLAGGLSAAATTLLPVTLVRRGEADREDLEVFNFEGGKPPAIALRPDDVVRVSAASELQQSVVVVGAIAGATPVTAAPTSSAASGTAGNRSTAPEEASATRRLPFVKGDTVRTLLERAGGVGPLADLTGSYIMRNGRAIPIDLNALIMLRDLGADRAIELGDTLLIPFKRRNVLVEGAVFAPGSYPFHPAFTVDQYVSIAGGASRNAQAMDAVKIVTPNGKTDAYRPDLKIEPGASIVVPERNFSRPEVVQVVLSIAGMLLSGIAVYIAATK